MKIDTWKVPAGIRFISEWEGFYLPEYPHIMDKQITGCGFTEWVITNPQNTILVSPRIILLENKAEQHPGEVFYAKNEFDNILNVDRDLHSIKKGEFEKKTLTGDENNLKEKVLDLRHKVLNYIDKCLLDNKPCKILVTYDSYRIVYEAILGSKMPEIFNTFYTVVDEFQSIFTDSKFKSSTELEFLNYLKKLNKLCFVSATPMIEEYLEMLPEFKNLPFIKLDWDTLDPGRVICPQLSIHPCQRINDLAVRIIQTYLEDNFEKTIVKDSSGNLKEIESKELVIYVNSVKNICDIIRKARLTFENTNVLCCGSKENQKKIRRAFGLGKGEVGGIGKVPLRDEPRKMFTLCTRTVYLGADFYSTCARSIILSDANIECLAVDITLDLPQILGRQRLDENPWKNRAELYVKFLSEKNKKTLEDFKKYIDNKISKTDSLLSIYSKGNSIEKHNLAENYQYIAKSKNYRDDYVAVNIHKGSDLVPEMNNLVMISEMRAFQIQQIDYKDRFRVLSSITKEGYALDPMVDQANVFLDKFRSLKYFTDKMKLLCNSDLDNKVLDIILPQIPIDYSKYLRVLGIERIKALNYQNSRLNEECSRLLNNQSISEDNIRRSFINTFPIGFKDSSGNIKTIIKNIYKNLGLERTAKAIDIGLYFNVKKVKVYKSGSSGDRIDGYEILGLKEE